MNYTENYHLPQWAESDRILMTDFNQMCADIEAGLSAAKAAADSAGATASQAKVAGDGLAPRVTAVENAVKFVKLGGPLVTTTDGQSMVFDLSGIDMEQYTMLLILSCAGSPSGVLSLQVNNGNMMTLLGCSGYEASGYTWLYRYGEYIAGYGVYLSAASASCRNESGSYTGCKWSEIHTLKAVGPVNAGATCTLYGIKA